MSPNNNEEELLAISQRLLDVIDGQDWSAYVELCDPTLTAFEPEALGHLVAGMDFHAFYLKAASSKHPQQSSMSSPAVRVMGEAALVTYVRLVQCRDDDGQASTLAFEETRLWQLQDGSWKHVHFHRTKVGHVHL